MIAFLKGTLAGKTATTAYIEVNGVGYAVGMSQASLSKLPEAGAPVEVHTFLQVRDDALALYGFLALEEKALFERLIGVGGVGPKVGLAILSVLSPDRVVLAVSAGDHKAFTAASGVGPKLGQRIVLELKDKVGKGLATGLGLADASGTAAPAATGGVAQAIAALTGLGYTGSEAAQAIARLDPSLPVQELIRLALQGIGKGR